MSEEDKLSIEEASQTIQGILETLVPPEEIEITNIFGEKFTVSGVCSARKQIKILRQIDKIRELGTDIEIEGSINGFINGLVSLASNEEILGILSGVFADTYPKELEASKKAAKKLKVDFEDNVFAAADLFPLEEMAAAIVPLFIRLARRTGQAIQALSSVA
jgi:hypothetical protein|tara:strand:+ start:24426 stop:24911 length:486 start_codon:yes stop_codon:yes gene_type:complete